MKTPKKQRSVIGIFFFILLTITSMGFKYPKEVALSPLKILSVPCSDNWIENTEHGPLEYYLKYPSFFNDQGELRLGFSIHHNQSNHEYEKWIYVYNDEKHIFEVELKKAMSPVQPVCIFDYDNNGYKDIKILFSRGGNSGNANNAQVYYLFQFKDEWKIISFFLRDSSYSWECDIDGDGKYELLKGHHQDITIPGYHDVKKDKWISDIHYKFLFINTYQLKNDRLILCNHLSKHLPKILCFQDTYPENLLTDDFLKYNQFSLPHELIYKTIKIKNGLK